MNSTIDLAQHHVDLIAEVLRKHLPPDTRIFLFGSRTMGCAKPFSDVDILVDAGKPLLLSQLASVSTALEESLLPYKVDIVDAWAISDAFRAAIQEQLVPFPVSD